MYLYRGRSARLSVARMIVWDVLNAGRSSKQSFTCREFYIKHKAELDARISKQVPGLPVEAVVKGALRGLSGRGLMVVQRVQAGGGATYSRNVYSPGRSLVGLSYGEALIEAQRRRTIV